MSRKRNFPRPPLAARTPDVDAPRARDGGVGARRATGAARPRRSARATKADRAELRGGVAAPTEDATILAGGAGMCVTRGDGDRALGPAPRPDRSPHPPNRPAAPLPDRTPRPAGSVGRGLLRSLSLHHHTSEGDNSDAPPTTRTNRRKNDTGLGLGVKRGA